MQQQQLRKKRKGKARKNQNGNRKKITPRSIMMKVPSLSPCARSYLQSLIDPFDLSLSPCVPDMVTLDSRKATVFVRGGFQTGTAGFGFVAVNPFRLAVNNVSPNAGVWSTLSTFTLLDVDLSGVVGTQNGGTNSDYSTGSVDTVNYRLVSAGLRIRYNGTELARNGTVTMLMDPNHSNVEGQTHTAILQHDYAQVIPVTRQWATITYSPVYPVELGYMPITRVPSPLTQQATTYPAATSGDNPFCMVAVCSSLTGANSATFDFEVVAHFEFTGEGVRGKSKSESDPLGFSAVQNAVPQGSYVGNAGSAIMRGLKDATFNLASMSGAYLAENPQLVQAGAQVLGQMAFGKKPLRRLAMERDVF